MACAFLGTLRTGLAGRSGNKMIYVVGRVAEVIFFSLCALSRFCSFFGESDVAGLKIPPLRSPYSRVIFGIMSSHHIVHIFLFATNRRSSRGGNFFSFVDVVISSPILEEILFRGALLRALLNRASRCPKACIILQAGLFGVTPAP